MVLITSSALSFDLTPTIDLEVGGITYKVPDANDEYRNEIYMAKKALKGDQDALDMLLKGQPYRLLYIGADTPKWLLIKRDEIRVLKEGERYGNAKKD